MEYKIVSTNNVMNLEEEVLINLMQGWKPLGGVSVVNDYTFYQAMTREEKDIPKEKQKLGNPTLTK